MGKSTDKKNTSQENQESQKYLIKVNQKMAQSKNMPVYFVGIIERKTPKAYKFIGSGVMLKKKMGVCSICGRDLTNPNSITLGIGPICAGNQGVSVLEGYTDKDIEKELHKIKIDTWLPASCVELEEDLSNIGSCPDITIPITEKKDEVKKEVVKELKFDMGVISIYFPFDTGTMLKVKALSGRRYKKEPAPHWTCPDTIQNRYDLQNLGFIIPDEKRGLGKTGETESIESIEMPPIPSHLNAVLMPFQKEGVRFVYEKKGRALISDQMGLGKSLQALTYLEMNSDKCIIICPASLKLTWAKELNKWNTNYNLWLCSGKKNKSKIQIVSNTLATKDVYIVNWDILGNATEEKRDYKTGKTKKVDIPYTGWVDFLLDMEPDLVIADEIHFAKNAKNIRSRGLIRIGKRVSHFIGLSGTPIENRPVEFFSTLNLINANLFSSWWNYTKRYCAAKQTRFGLDSSGCSNIEELHEIVSNVMIRRKKEDVLPDLPKKRRIVIPVEITNRKKYDLAERDIIEFLRNTVGKDAAEKAGNAEALVEISKLRELAYQGKKKAVVRWVTDYLETENKLVIFAIHKEVLDYLEEYFKDICVRIDGQTPVNNRQNIVDQFQTDPKIKLFLGNVKAAGVGLTLTAANSTCFVEFPWSPGQSDQAEDRVHRIGQESDSVNAYYLVAEKTIDIKFLEMLDEKRKIVDGVLDGKTVENVSLIKILLNS